MSTTATARLFRAGLLVTSRTALERFSEVDMVVFDKTGTLTTGAPVLEGSPDPEALAIAAGLAQASSHRVSRAIVAAAKARNIAPAVLDRTKEHPGDGIKGCLDGRRVRLGRAYRVGVIGDAAVWLGVGDAAPVPLHMHESLRDDAARTVAALRVEGYKVALLSGDTPAAVARIAETLGIQQFEAAMTPARKVAWVEVAARRGHKVLMVGDGLNDTGCLAVAHAGMAPGSALDAARSAADVILLSGGLNGVPRALLTARLAIKRMRENIGLSIAYNIVSIP